MALDRSSLKQRQRDLPSLAAQEALRPAVEALTKQGDAELRRLLYLCAQASVRTKNSPSRTQYEREPAKWLPKTAALCAIARKMARLCWSLHKQGTLYDSTRVGTPVENRQDQDPNFEDTKQTAPA